MGAGEVDDGLGTCRPYAGRTMSQGSMPFGDTESRGRNGGVLAMRRMMG